MPLHTSQSGHHKQINKQVLLRLWRKGNPRTLLVEMQTGAATVKNYEISSKSFCFPQLQSPLVFTARLWGFYLPSTETLGYRPVVGLGSLGPDILPYFYLPHVSAGLAHFASPPLQLVSVWFL